MRYLRMLSNSTAAALVATAYMLALVLELNPSLPLNPSRLMPLVVTVGLFYTFHLTVMFYVLLVLRQLLARELFSPAWLSVSVLAWLTAISASAAAVLMWRNAGASRLVVDSAAASTIVQSGYALIAASVCCVIVAVLHRGAPHARAASASMFLLIVIASIAVPLALRGRGTPPLLEARPIDAPLAASDAEHPARVVVIAIDGGSLDYITSATAEGRLPNFGRLLDAGAVRHLATLHPTSPAAVWAAVATGKLPQKNGVRSAGIYQIAGSVDSIQLLPDFCFAHGLVHFGFLVEQPHASSALRTRTLWTILSTHGVSVAVVGWPLTQPAPIVRGFLVSDTFHRVAAMPSGLDDPSAIYPPELQTEAMAAIENVKTEGDAAVVTASAGLDERHETPARIDLAYDRIARALARSRSAQVTLTRYQSLDAIGHYFLRYATPSEFGDVTDDERRRLGPVLDRHYALVDEAVGRALARLEADDLLLVISGYGMEPLGFGKRLLERVIGDPELSGTHENAPDGFLMAYGGAVARGRLQARASVVDVVPTILYFLGLPTGRDMDGYVRTDLFQPSFTEERPIAFIPTYDR